MPGLQKKITPIVDRLLLIKKTRYEAEKYLSNVDNVHHLAIGISLLHDAVESLFWTISGTNPKYAFKDRADFLSKFDVLKNEAKEKLAFDRTQVNNLNTVRNSYKHHGILPEQKQAQKIADSILEGLDETVKKVFKKDIKAISFSSLLDNEELRLRVEYIEKSINKSKKTAHYKQLLEEIGLVFFDYFERNSAESSLYDLIRNKETRFGFAERLDSTHLHIDLLEIGVIPFYYHRFKNLVPTYGVDRKNNNQLVIKKDTVHWNRENWNRLNVEFCLNWLIDFFLRRQWMYSKEKYTLELGAELQIIEVLADEIVDVAYRLDNKPAVPKITLKKGTKFVGYSDFIDGNWQDFEEMENNEATNLLLRGNKVNVCNVKVPRESLKVYDLQIELLEETELESYLQNFDDCFAEAKK